MSEQNKALVRRAIEEVLSHGDWEVFEEIYAPNVVTHYQAPVVPAGKLEGRDALRQIVESYRTAFPDLIATVEDVLAEGDKVVIRWTSTGTHRGPLGTVPATGKRVSVRAMAITRIAGGQLVEGWVMDDQLGMLQQLGVVPSMAGD